MIKVRKDIVHIRLFGVLIIFKRTPLLFSEKAGYTKYYKLLFGWRLVIRYY